MEAAAAAAPVAATGAAAPVAAPTTAGAPSAGATLTSVPAGPDWAGSFKEETRNYISQKGFKTPEALAESYKHLEAKMSTRAPDERTLILPEKMEGADARAVWERLGAPKEAKGYALPREGADPAFTEWAEGAFYQNNLTKSQADGVVKAYNEKLTASMAAQQEFAKNAIAQADQSLQKQWGNAYESNINIAKQGAKILGLDAKTLDMMEALQGREALFKNLQRIGVSMGESKFVDGAASPATTPEQAQQQIKDLMQDAKFVKKVNRGDQESLKRWNDLNRLAAPGDKSIG